MSGVLNRTVNQIMKVQRERWRYVLNPPNDFSFIRSDLLSFILGGRRVDAQTFLFTNSLVLYIKINHFNPLFLILFSVPVFLKPQLVQSSKR